MSQTLRFEILESAEELKQQMANVSQAIQRSKLQVLWWIQTAQVKSIQEVVAWSGYHRSTIWRWLKQYRDEGLEALLEVKPHPGRPRAISGELLTKLEQELKDPEGFESYGEVQQWLSLLQGEEIPYKTVHKTVRYHLKGKLKTPRPVSEKQKADTVDAFKQTSPVR